MPWHDAIAAGLRRPRRPRAPGGPPRAKLTVAGAPRSGGVAPGLLKVSSDRETSPIRMRMRTTEPRKLTSSIVPTRRLRPGSAPRPAPPRAALPRAAGPPTQISPALACGRPRAATISWSPTDDPAGHGVEHPSAHEAERADERGDEAGTRRVVDLERRAHLLDPALVHHHDPVRHRQGFLLVVGDVDRGDAERLLQRADLLAQRDADLGVQGRQGLVEQQHLRLDRERPGQGHALLLAAGELVGIAGAQGRQLDQPQHLVDPARDLGLRPLRDLEAEGRRSRPRSCWGTARRTGTPCRRCAGSARRAVTSRPSMRIAPEVGISKPATMRRVVVLPQPEGPRNETNSPRSTARSKFCTTAWLLEALVHVVDVEEAPCRSPAPLSAPAGAGCRRR